MAHRARHRVRSETGSSSDEGYDSVTDLPSEIKEENPDAWDLFCMHINRECMPGLAQHPDTTPQRRWEIGDTSLVHDNPELVKELTAKEINRKLRLKAPTPSKMKKSRKRKEMEGIVEIVIDWRYMEDQEEELKKIEETGIPRAIGFYELGTIHEQALNM